MLGINISTLNMFYEQSLVSYRLYHNFLLKAADIYQLLYIHAAMHISLTNPVMQQQIPTHDFHIGLKQKTLSHNANIYWYGRSNDWFNITRTLLGLKRPRMRPE